jgi:hypothetical protein
MSSPVVAHSSGALVPQAPSDAREVSRWQRKLLPFMIRFMVVIAIGFFALSTYDVYELRRFVANDSSGGLRARVDEMVRARAGAQANTAGDLVQQSLLVLEADAMENRYRQASALLMSRIWTRQLAFLTGMVLAFIGSIFILGKMTEGKSDVSLGADQLKGSISSTSPGLILAFFGTLLMAISLVVQPRIEVQDRPLYFTMMGVVQNPNAQKAATSATAAPEVDTGAIDVIDDAPKARPARKTK